MTPGSLYFDALSYFVKKYSKEAIYSTTKDEKENGCNLKTLG